VKLVVSSVPPGSSGITHPYPAAVTQPADPTFRTPRDEPLRVDYPLATEAQLPYRTSHVDQRTSKQADIGGASQPLCQLSEVQPGVSVRIKQLSASPELSKRLRELGFCEEQRIKLLSRNANLICQVCNARLGLSSQLADLIWVEQVKPPQRLAA
jgi:Fe2+ transport system protein FeoA